MPEEIDFSGATRGKFYREGIKLRLPIYCAQRFTRSEAAG